MNELKENLSSCIKIVKMKSYLNITLLFSISIALFACKSITIAGNDKKCFDQAFGDLTYKTCVSMSLIEQDLPGNDIQALLTAEQKRITEYIKSTYDLANINTNELSRKWNKIVDDIAAFLPSPGTIDPLSIDAISEFKKSNPDLYDFFLQKLHEFLESAPPPVFREKNGQIILENDPSLDLVPILFEKIIDYLSESGKLSEKEEKEIRERANKELLTIMSEHILKSKYLYPIQYDFLLIFLAQKELHKLYVALNKKVFIIANQSFEGAMSDHVGNLFISQEVIRDLDENSLETIMVHEAVHVLEDNSNPIIQFLFRKNLNRLKQNLGSLSEQLLGEPIDQDEFDSQLKLLGTFLESLYYEPFIDMRVLSYFAKQPSNRKEYIKVLSSFEKISKERVAAIDSINECIDSGEEFQLNFAMEGGVLIDRSQIPSTSKCRRVKASFEEYFKHTIKQTVNRMFKKDADLFFQTIHDLLEGKRREDEKFIN